MNKFANFSKNAWLSIGLLVILIAGIIFTILQVQQQQEIRQRAQTPTSCQVTQAKCTWSPAANATQYRATVTDTVSGAIVIDQSTTTTQIIFPAQPGRTYRCTVYAQNECGAGLPGTGTSTCPGPTPTPTPIIITQTPTPTPTPSPTVTQTPTPTPTTTPTPAIITTTPIPTPVVIVTTPIPTPTPTIPPPGINTIVTQTGAIGVVLLIIIGGALILL